MRRSYLVYFLTVLIYGGLATEAKTQQIVEELKKWIGVGYKDHVIIGEWEHVGYSSKNLHFFPDATVSIDNQKCKWTIVDNQSVKIECESALGGTIHVFTVKKVSNVLVGSFSNENNKQFKRPEENANDFLMNRVKLDKIRFFESGDQVPDIQQRKYKTRFPQTNSRYINPELNIRYPNPWRQIDFKINVKIYDSNGAIYANYYFDAYLPTNWNSSVHTVGWGGKESGTWLVGTYKTEFYIQDKLIGTGSFEVY